MATEETPTEALGNSTSTKQQIAPINTGDAELEAINVVVGALGSLSEDQRTRAIDYVVRRFNHVIMQTSAEGTAPPINSLNTVHSSTVQSDFTRTAIQDIRTLKEEKNPKSANEMAALVAFYVSEIAPPPDRKAEVSKPDIERYFKLAQFKLPADASFTLVNARNAGYLDSVGGGQYKLNPVGYNLVVHRMGVRDNDSSDSSRPRKPAKKNRAKSAKKSAPPKK